MIQEVETTFLFESKRFCFVESSRVVNSYDHENRYGRDADRYIFITKIVV